MPDPLSRKLANAPVEDEEIREEVVAEFGLTMADFNRMGQTPLLEELNGPRD